MRKKKDINKILKNVKFRSIRSNNGVYGKIWKGTSIGDRVLCALIVFLIMKVLILLKLPY